jgi:hypothetical protein
MERLKLGEFLNKKPSYIVDCPWSSTAHLPRALTIVGTIRSAGGYLLLSTSSRRSILPKAPICPNLNGNAAINDIRGTVGLVYSYGHTGPQKKAPGRSGSYKRGEWNAFKKEWLRWGLSV